MPEIKILPHHSLCPEGVVFEAPEGASLIDVSSQAGVHIEHACEKSCACTTCHVVVVEGFESLEEASDTEEDMLDKAWGLKPASRLSCQVRIGTQPLTVELPKYTINQVSENH